MPLLRMRHFDNAGTPWLEVTLDGLGESLQVAYEFRPQYSEFDLEDIRWYHENYRDSWEAASNAVIRRIQNAERKIGEILYSASFAPSGGTGLPEKIRQAGSDLRVEIVDDVQRASVPWEMIVDPTTGHPLALTAAQYVRTVYGERPEETISDRATRNLLVIISRPKRTFDVAYWSVAYALWRELSDFADVKVEVLRPSTFDSLESRLRKAAEIGVPFTAVHFDGHGTVTKTFGLQSAGFLVFETEDWQEPEFVDGTTVGRLLADAGVSLFTMNACRSGDSEGSDRSIRVGSGASTDVETGQPSIVEHVIQAGVPACIGMRREIYPETASRFFKVFYRSFFEGREVGEAARLARVELHGNPLSAGMFREQSEPINDWSIPVIGQRTRVRLENSEGINGRPGRHDPPLVGIPDRLTKPAYAGFGAEILWMEEAMRSAPIVHINGALLSGKSRLAVEYASWRSTTSPTESPIHYIRLSPDDTPTSVEGRMPATNKRSPGQANDRDDWRGILVVDQADRLRSDTEVYLHDRILELSSTSQVIVTSRSPRLPWLPDDCASVSPSIMYVSERAELGQRWGESLGVEFDPSAYFDLLSFAGGRPGMVLLILGAVRGLIERHEASASQITTWLGHRDWDRLKLLARDPGLGLPSLEALVDEVVDHLRAICSKEELMLIPAIARFNISFDVEPAVQLMTATRGLDVAETALSVIQKLEVCGLITEVGGWSGAADWQVPWLLKFVCSRLNGPDQEELDGPMVAVMSKVCADLMARFRIDPMTVHFKLRTHRQNIADAMWCALRRRDLQHAAHLVEAFCVYNRHVGEVAKSSRVLDSVLLFFIDGNTGRLRPEATGYARRVWDQAIWIAPRWPQRGDMPESTALMPLSDDNYAVGLWHFANTRKEMAVRAFLAELDAPSAEPRYAPGDIEHHLAESLYSVENPARWSLAMKFARRSGELRTDGDSIGRAWSFLTQARLLAGAALSGSGRSEVKSDVPVAELSGVRAKQLDAAATLLRKAESQPSIGEEAKSQIAILWSEITLSRGDLSSALSYVQDAARIMMSLEDRSYWRVYWRFAHRLLSHGWIARSHEFAMAAFHGAMQAGLVIGATPIREFVQHLEATYPELRHE